MEENEGKGEWTVYIGKRKKRFLAWQERQQNENSYDHKERKKVELWYPRDTWQYNLVKNKYVFSDELNNSVLDSFGLSELTEEFKNCKNNYKRNNVYHKLTKVVTEEKWNEIKEKVSLK